MNTAGTWAVALSGLHGHLVEVEADLSEQTPQFSLIGLPDKALAEATNRVQNACRNSGIDLPRRRLTVNLSPASLPKHGAGFDVAIAVAALTTENALERGSVSRTVHIGELGLDGRLRPVPGVLPAVYAARKAGFDRVVVPSANEEEARLVEGMEICAAVSLAQVCIWHGAELEAPELAPVRGQARQAEVRVIPDLSEVIGQADAVDALVVAAAGGHHLLLSGPPGAGKTMLARRLPGILPPLEDAAALEVASIRSLSGESVTELDRGCPFEAPHHSASVAALVGGGSREVRPGAIARAHRGVLFLDEAAEYSRVALDALRQPLETGHIEIHRAGFSASFPARFQLVMALNPCPCGNYGVRGGECICPPMAIRRYAGRLSGPLRDRVDIELHVSRVASAQRENDDGAAITSAQARQRVVAARERARGRLSGTPWALNSEVSGSWLRQGEGRVPAAAREPLDRALGRGALTLRGYDRTLRLAWTLADLEDVPAPRLSEVGRALYLKKGVAA